MIKLLIIFIVCLFPANKLFAEDNFIYPKSTDSLECGSTITIQWTNENNVPADLYYSYDDKIWTLIESNLFVSNYLWTAPITISKKIYFKVELSKQTSNRIIWDNKDAHNNWVLMSKFVANDRIISVGRDDSVKYWDIPSRQLIKTLNIQNSQNTNFALEYARGKILVFQDYSVFTWDTELNTTSRIYSNTQLGTIRSAAYDPNNQEVAITSENGFVQIIDLFGEEMAKFTFGTLKTIHTLDYSDDGKYLAVAGDDGYVYVINLETEEILSTVQRHGDSSSHTVWSVDISPNNIFIISGGVDDKARLWDFKTLELIASYVHNSDIRATKFNSNGTLYLSGSLDNTLHQYSVTNKLEIPGADLNHQNQILWAEYLNKGDTLITAGRDNGFKVWKNGQSDVTEIKTSANLYQNLEIWFPEIFVKLNDDFQIPLKTKGNLDFIDSLKLFYTVPVDIADIDGFVKPGPINRDELLLAVIEKNIPAEFILHQAIAMMSDRKKGDLKINNIKIYPDANYKLLTKDGFIEIIDECDIDTSRFVMIDKSNTSIKIISNVISSNIKISLYSNIDASYSMKIYNLNGLLVGELFEAHLKHGLYEFSFDCSELANGVYYLITIFENKFLSEKFIKSNK